MSYRPDVQAEDVVVDTPAANTSAVCIKTGTENERIRVHRVLWSYDADPTAGRLTVSDGTTTLDFDITAAGPGSLDLEFSGRSGATVTATLAAAGASVAGKLNLFATAG